MATKKKQLLIEYELEFLEKQLEELKVYIASIDLTKLEDRLAYKETKSGGVIPILISKKEDQRKDKAAAMKDYAEILRTVDAMREKEEDKVKTRGDQGISTLGEKFLESRK